MVRADVVDIFEAGCLSVSNLSMNTRMGVHRILAAKIMRLAA